MLGEGSWTLTSGAIQQPQLKRLACRLRAGFENEPSWWKSHVKSGSNAKAIIYAAATMTWRFVFSLAAEANHLEYKRDLGSASWLHTRITPVCSAPYATTFKSYVRLDFFLFFPFFSFTANITMSDDFYYNQSGYPPATPQPDAPPSYHDTQSGYGGHHQVLPTSEKAKKKRKRLIFSSIYISSLRTIRKVVHSLGK